MEEQATADSSGAEFGYDSVFGINDLERAYGCNQVRIASRSCPQVRTKVYSLKL